jgi:hypothetical protein
MSISTEFKELLHLIKKGKALNLQFPTDKMLTQPIFQHELRLKELRKEREINKSVFLIL